MIREIPKAFEYTCDQCRTTHRQENASGHYTNSRPPGWVGLKVLRDAYDFQGQAVAPANIDRLLCEKCGPILLQTINNAFTRQS